MDYGNLTWLDPLLCSVIVSDTPACWKRVWQLNVELHVVQSSIYEYLKSYNKPFAVLFLSSSDQCHACKGMILSCVS